MRSNREGSGFMPCRRRAGSHALAGCEIDHSSCLHSTLPGRMAVLIPHRRFLLACAVSLTRSSRFPLHSSPPTIRLVDMQPVRSPSATNSLYLPPLEDPNRPNSMLQPAPSFLSAGNRDSSYSSSLADHSNRQSWGSAAMVSSTTGNASPPLN